MQEAANQSGRDLAPTRVPCVRAKGTTVGLIACPVCDGRLSERARACPHCGDPFGARRKRGRISPRTTAQWALAAAIWALCSVCLFYVFPPQYAPILITLALVVAALLVRRDMTRRN